MQTACSEEALLFQSGFSKEKTCGDGPNRATADPQPLSNVSKIQMFASRILSLLVIASKIVTTFFKVYVFIFCPVNTIFSGCLVLALYLNGFSI